MTSTNRGPKQWRLTKNETLTSFEDWRHNITYSLKQDQDFAPFIRPNATWKKKSKTDLTRGLTVQEGSPKTVANMVEDLEQFLGQIANFCPVIKRAAIVNSSTCLTDVWQAIRLHFGFHSSGANFIDFSSMKLEADERPEDLYQRMASFIDDNLLRTNDSIKHDGDTVEEDEELTPTLENLVVLLWLEKVHPKLPQIVKRRYGSELRDKTLYSLKPEISMSLSTLLEEAQSDDAHVMRSSSYGATRRRSDWQRTDRNTSFGSKKPSSPPSTPTCPLCKQAGRSTTNHFLSSCRYLPESDRKFMMANARCIQVSDGDGEECCASDASEGEAESPSKQVPVVSRHVQIKSSPHMNVFCNQLTATLTLDSGSEADLIREDVAIDLNLTKSSSNQLATLADGKTSLGVVGEVHTEFERDGKTLHFSGLIVKELDVGILCGVPFLERNDITLRPARKQVILRDNTTITYGSKSQDKNSSVHRGCSIVRVDRTSTIWPGEYVDLKVSDEFPSESTVAIEPCTPELSEKVWPAPGMYQTVDHTVRLVNTTKEPQTIKRHNHLCQASTTFSPSTGDSAGNVSLDPNIMKKKEVTPPSRHSAMVSIDPDNILSPTLKQKFSNLLHQFDSVFDANFSAYNHAFGKFEAVVNMGPVKPPQRKGRLPLYSRDKLVELQQHFDNLEELGVFAKPELVGVTVEYVNPSLLVK